MPELYDNPVLESEFVFQASDQKDLKPPGVGESATGALASKRSSKYDPDDR